MKNNLKTRLLQQTKYPAAPDSYFIADNFTKEKNTTPGNGLIIAVEGFDGSGKSTVAARLSALLGAELHRTPEGNFREARNYFDRDLSDPSERISFYMGSCLDLSFKLKTIKEKGGIAVIDRYYYSTLSYHYNFPEITDVMKHICTESLTQPDVIIYIHPEYKIVEKRLSERGMEMSDTLFFTENYFNKIHAEYASLFNRKVIAHGNTGTVEQTVNDLISALTETFPVLREATSIYKNIKVSL